MKKTILILNQKVYDFTTEKGERVIGQKVTYLNQEVLDLPNLRGVAPFVINVDKQIPPTQIPGVFEVDIYNMPSSKGQSIEVLTNFKHIKNVDFVKLFNA